MVIVPPSVVANWAEHFKDWGYFSVQIFGNDRIGAIRNIKFGTHEILLCPNSLIKAKLDCFPLMFDVDWKLMIIDEFHMFKNNNSKSYEHVRELRDHCRCPIVGLTGTMMQNNYKVRMFPKIVELMIIFC